MRNIMSVLALLSASPLCDLLAQAPGLVEPGEWVRVTGRGYIARECAPLRNDQDQSCEKIRFRCASATGCPPIQGTLVRWEADTVYLDNGAALSLASLVRLEVRRRKASGAGKGTLVGGGAGAVLGFFVAAYVEGFSLFEESHPCGDGGACLWQYPAVGAGAGAILGAIFGTIKFTRWKDVPLDRLRMTVGGRNGGLGLAASITF